MTPKRLMLATAGAALLFGLTVATQAAVAEAIYDDRPILVRPAPRLLRWRDCPTCYKGYDFGRDCFQNVWTGFQNVRANVCLWGWQ